MSIYNHQYHSAHVSIRYFGSVCSFELAVHSRYPYCSLIWVCLVKKCTSYSRTLVSHLQVCSCKWGHIWYTIRSTPSYMYVNYQCHIVWIMSLQRKLLETSFFCCHSFPRVCPCTEISLCMSSSNCSSIGCCNLDWRSITEHVQPSGHYLEAEVPPSGGNSLWWGFPDSSPFAGCKMSISSQKCNMAALFEEGNT